MSVYMSSFWTRSVRVGRTKVLCYSIPSYIVARGRERDSFSHFQEERVFLLVGGKAGRESVHYCFIVLGLVSILQLNHSLLVPFCNLALFLLLFLILLMLLVNRSYHST